MSELSLHLLAAGGGAVGASLRWFATLLAARWRIPVWWAILFVNTMGCLALGVLAGVVREVELEAFLLVGLLGGFTTFSTASLDVWVLWRSGERGNAACCLLATPMLAIAAMWLGVAIGQGGAA